LAELALGRLGAPHGLDGSIKLVSFSGETGHLTKLDEVTLKGNGRSLKARVESVRETGDSALIQFAGYGSPETVRVLSGLELWAPREKAAPLYEDQYYYADLVGCSLVHDGKVIATVAAVCDGGGGDLLEVSRAGGESVYVPFRKEFVGKVDIKGRKIELLAPWILD